MEHFIKVNKRAQINQAFTYIAMILVIGVIVVFGAQAIMRLMSANCENDRVTFESKLNSYINDYSDMGSSHVEKLKLPCNAKELCLVDSSNLNQAPVQTLQDKDAVMSASVAQGTHNIFIKGDFVERVGLSNKLKIESDPFLCITNTNGYVKLRFIGQGRTTRIEDAS